MDGWNRDMTDREFGRVVDLVCGRLSQDESAALRRSASSNADLRNLIERVAHVISGMGSLGSEAVEPGLVARVKQIYDATLLMPTSVDTDWDLIVATLVEDTRERETLAGFRGVAASYQLTFNADGVEVHLQILPDAGDSSIVAVMGQIEGDGAERVEVLSMVGGDVVAGGSCDEHGYFTLQIGVGTYDLVIVAGGRRIIIRAVEMG